MSHTYLRGGTRPAQRLLTQGTPLSPGVGTVWHAPRCTITGAEDNSGAQTKAQDVIYTRAAVWKWGFRHQSCSLYGEKVHREWNQAELSENKQERESKRTEPAAMFALGMPRSHMRSTLRHTTNVKQYSSNFECLSLDVKMFWVICQIAQSFM